MVERLLTKGVSAERTRYFPNWVDTAHVRPSHQCPGYRQQLGIAGDAVVILYSGSLGAKQGLPVIPQMAKALAHRTDVQFVVCGDGVLKPQLEAAAVGLPNMHFLPLQPFDRLGDLLCMADIHFLPQSPDAADLVMPSKLSGMLASGRPVIATCRPGTELNSVVSTCGLVVPPEDSAALAAAIIRLADDPELRRDLGRRARSHAEAHFEREAVLGRVFASCEKRALTVVNDAVA
jgi:colanic acid biosynthesis glycosyl transferase WcaI